MQSDPETTTRSAPESPVIGLIESSASAGTCQEAGTSGISKESAPGMTKPSPSAAAGETSAAVGIGSGEGGGSRNPAVRVLPFQSLPQSAQEEMGK